MQNLRIQRRVVRGLSIEFLHRRASRDVVLLIHGNSSSKEAFARQFPALLNSNLSIVAPDLPGHGGSDDAAIPSSVYSFPGYAALLHALMVALGHMSYRVVGWSLGGHIGIEMWATREAVQSLLITGTPPIHLSSAGVSAGFHWTAATALAGRRRFDRYAARRYALAMMDARAEGRFDFVEKAERTDGNARLWMVRNGMSGVGVDQVAAVAGIDRPIAIIQGRSDPFVDVGYIAGLNYKNLSGGAPAIIDGGHAVHWNNCDEFNCRMLRFLME